VNDLLLDAVLYVADDASADGGFVRVDFEGSFELVDALSAAGFSMGFFNSGFLSTSPIILRFFPFSSS
jgi:hypothetical protein